MKAWTENASLNIFTVEDSVIIRVEHDDTSLAVATTKSDARWYGKRILELAGCSVSGRDPFGMPFSEAHAFAVAATKCYCGKASR